MDGFNAGAFGFETRMEARESASEAAKFGCDVMRLCVGCCPSSHIPLLLFDIKLLFVDRFEPHPFFLSLSLSDCTSHLTIEVHVA